LDDDDEEEQEEEQEERNRSGIYRLCFFFVETELPFGILLPQILHSTVTAISGDTSSFTGPKRPDSP